MYVCCSDTVQRNSNKRRGIMKEKKPKGKEIHVDASYFYYSFNSLHIRNRLEVTQRKCLVEIIHQFEFIFMQTPK